MRFSVTDLETYRRYKEREDITLEDCLAQLRREALLHPNAIAGRALHSALEHAEYGEESVSIERDGYRFSFDCDVDLAVPSVRELKGEMELLTPTGPVTLVGVVDAIDSSIYDYKLTGRFDAERLADSYQWRCYLMMFKANRFVYRVFVGEEQSQGSGFDGKAFHEWRIWEYHEFPVYRYPMMEADVAKEVSEFAEFSSKYLNEAFSAVSADARLSAIGNIGSKALM